MNISVIIPVYNAERFLEKAVKSALQFGEVKEILLCEDKSPDNSLEICRNLVAKDARIKLLQHPDKENHGAGATRNLGLKNATQEFVAFLDADDYYLPNRFEAEKEIFRDEKIAGVFGALGTEFLSEKGKEEFKGKFGETKLTTSNYAVEGKQIFYDLLGFKPGFGTFFHLDTLTVRKSCLQKSGLLFNENLRVHQDQDFITKLAYHCYLKSGEITEAIAVRGVHDENRITKIKPYSDLYNQRQSLLWNSLYEWSNGKDLKKEYLEHILLKKKSFDLSLKKGSEKFIQIITSAAQNPRILKTRYRFTFLKR